MNRKRFISIVWRVLGRALRLAWRGVVMLFCGAWACLGTVLDLSDSAEDAQGHPRRDPAGRRNRFVVMLDGLMDTGSPTEDGAKTGAAAHGGVAEEKGWPSHHRSDQADGALMHEIAEATNRTAEGRRVGHSWPPLTMSSCPFKAIYISDEPGQQALVEVARSSSTLRSAKRSSWSLSPYGAPRSR